MIRLNLLQLCEIFFFFALLLFTTKKSFVFPNLDREKTNIVPKKIIFLENIIQN